MRNDLEMELATIVCNNPRALEEYAERKRSVAELTASVADEEAALAAIEGEVATVKAEWLPELERVVSTVNAAFGAAFGEIGCAGEVVLDTAGGGDDFGKYAIRIMVKFRDGEDLQPLTGTRQSGGERSVATILYLLALQGVTVTPFRVVDEINQGMDPVNERKVFDRLVAAATREGTPQCFLLTPKLLPDLEYGRSVTVLQIINGVIEGGAGAGWDLAALVGTGRQGRGLVAAARG
jgi:chromosome segregation ATPase